MLDGFDARERKLFRRLATPTKIQRFLDEEIGYNKEPGGYTCYSPRMALRKGVAHCMEGALLGALALRELAMSYFEHYYNPAGEKTLSAYSRPVNLVRFDRGVRWSETLEEVWAIPEYLCEIPHTNILKPAMERRLSRMDRRLYDAG